MTLQDLANYTAIEREPLSITYKNTKIFSTVAPSSGSVVLSALKVSLTKVGICKRDLLMTVQIFEGYNGSQSLPGQVGFNESTHYLVEATKFGCKLAILCYRGSSLKCRKRFTDSFRTSFGDPAYTANVTELEKEYITYATAEEARSRINPNQTFSPSYYDPQKLTATREAGTSHMAIVDKDGMSISLTTTVNLYFGAQISKFSHLLVIVSHIADPGG